MNLRLQKNRWRLMLAVNAAVLIGVFSTRSAASRTSPIFISWSTIISALPSARSSARRRAHPGSSREHRFARKRLGASDFRSPDPHVKRALAAMADMRFLKPDHQRAEFRQAQPLRHLAAQHPALGFRARCTTLAGNDENETQALAVGTV